MRTELKLLIVLGVLGAVALSILATRKGARSQEDPPAPYSLRWRAQQALANGETEIRQVIAPEYQRVSDLNDGLANYSLILAQPIDQIVGENDGSVGTWYKFRVLEQLTLRPLCAECQPLPDHPFGSLASNELAIPRASGTLNVDGVSISTEENGFPGFILTQKYLLFVSLDPNKQVAIVTVGPVGAFMIDVNGTIVPVLPETSQVSSDLASTYGNSLAQLRAGLGLGSSGTPTPTPAGSCHPSQILISRCENNGGTWDYDSCTCQ
ncbi:MAG TPA: hypothetical protein VHQ64_14495 [Pyrinomonadaceae bacterium]|jgi:hypothetical protein|nr:hypothetical protein [Pyrinomonadaceae bacterium]